MIKVLETVDDVISAINEVVGNLVRKIAIGTFVLALLCLVIGLTISTIRSFIDRYRVSGLSATAQRLGFVDSEDGLASYICYSLDPGMSRAQVKQVLLGIGKVKVKPQGPLENDHECEPRGEAVSYDQLRLTIPDSLPLVRKIRGTVFPMYAYYDQSGGLVDLADVPCVPEYSLGDLIHSPRELNIYEMTE